MKTKLYIALLFSVSTVACSIGFSIDDPQKFSCTDKEDCESGYTCKASVCEPEGPIEDDCFDEDGDGFGVGPDRVCQLCQTDDTKCEEDPDDTNELIYPGAPEQCDGLDNDSDGTIDNVGIPCTSANDCAPVDQTANPGVVILCSPSKICEATMRNQRCFDGTDPCPCNTNVLTCTDGAFPAVPEICQ